MKTINVTFEDEEFLCLQKIKEGLNVTSWRDFILSVVKAYPLTDIKAQEGHENAN